MSTVTPLKAETLEESSSRSWLFWLPAYQLAEIWNVSIGPYLSRAYASVMSKGLWCKTDRERVRRRRQELYTGVTEWATQVQELTMSSGCFGGIVCRSIAKENPRAAGLMSVGSARSVDNDPRQTHLTITLFLHVSQQARFAAVPEALLAYFA